MKTCASSDNRSVLCRKSTLSARLIFFLNFHFLNRRVSFFLLRYLSLIGYSIFRWFSSLGLREGNTMFLAHQVDDVIHRLVLLDIVLVQHILQALPFFAGKLSAPSCHIDCCIWQVWSICRGNSWHCLSIYLRPEEPVVKM